MDTAPHFYSSFPNSKNTEATLRIFAQSKLECPKWRVSPLSSFPHFPHHPGSFRLVSPPPYTVSHLHSLSPDPIHQPFPGCKSPSFLFLLIIAMRGQAVFGCRSHAVPLGCSRRVLTHSGLSPRCPKHNQLCLRDVWEPYGAFSPVNGCTLKSAVAN